MNKKNHLQFKEDFGTRLQRAHDNNDLQVNAGMQEPSQNGKGLAFRKSIDRSKQKQRSARRYFQVFEATLLARFQSRPSSPLPEHGTSKHRC